MSSKMHIFGTEIEPRLYFRGKINIVYNLLLSLKYHPSSIWSLQSDASANELTVVNGGKNVDHFKFSAMGIVLLLEFEGKKWNPSYILGKRKSINTTNLTKISHPADEADC